MRVMRDGRRFTVKELRPGNAGASSGLDQIAVAEHAIAQIPRAHVEDIEQGKAGVA